MIFAIYFDINRIPIVMYFYAKFEHHEDVNFVCFIFLSVYL